MIINDQSSDYLEVQLIGKSKHKIMAKTSKDTYVFVYPTQEQATDPLFWKSLVDIINNKLWLPVTKSFHQLLPNDWLVEAN